MYVLALLTAVIIALSAKKAIDLFLRTGLERAQLARGLDPILFWGCISAVLGFLGQFTGTYLALMVIRSAGAINPSLVAEGLAASLTTTVCGLAILAMAAVLWFALRCRLHALDSRSHTGSPGL